MIICAIFLLLSVYPALAIFDYDRAIAQSQKGNWNDATQRLKKALADHPENADILYDLGVSTFKNAEFDKALAYFTKSADTATAPQALREQAYFNAGNAQVRLKQLEQAIESYDKVLALNPDHKKAKHNKEVVKKMLESSLRDKASADRQQKEEKEQKNKEKEDENKQNQQDQKNNEKQKDSDSRQNKDQSQDQQQEDNNKSQNQKSADDKSESNPSKDQGADKQEKEQEKKKDQSADAKAMADKQKQQKNNQEQEKQSPATNQKSTEANQKLSAALEHALNEREKKDAQLNKKMIKAMAEAQNGGKNGNNCW